MTEKKDFHITTPMTTNVLYWQGLECMSHHQKKKQKKNSMSPAGSPASQFLCCINQVQWQFSNRLAKVM